MSGGMSFATHRIWRMVAPVCCAVSLIVAGDEGLPGGENLERLAHSRDWDKAGEELSALEQAGWCAGAVCLVARAAILSGQGRVQEVREPARQAIAKLDEPPALSSWWYNELGVALQQIAGGKAADLRLAEAALRKGVEVHHKRACNVKYNLAKVLKALGRAEESKKIMDQLKAEGMLVDPQMSLLGTFETPGKQ